MFGSGFLYILLWSIAMCCDIACGGLSVYALTELEMLISGERNIYDGSLATLNKNLMIEFAACAMKTLILLLIGEWIWFVLSLPVLGFHAYQYVHKMHEYDIQDMFKFDYAKKKKTVLYFKIAYYFSWVFYMFYRLIYILVRSVFRTQSSGKKKGSGLFDAVKGFKNWGRNRR